MGLKGQKKRKLVSSSDDEASVERYASDSDTKAVPKVDDKSKSSKSPTRKHESDDEDSTAEATPTVKKPRMAGNVVHRTADGDSYIDIGKKKRVTVRVFKGTPLIDIREYYGPEGDEKPGKKGISLTVEQWEAVREHCETIDELLSNLTK